MNLPFLTILFLLSKFNATCTAPTSKYVYMFYTMFLDLSNKTICMLGYAKEECFLNFENKLLKKFYNHILSLSKTQH